MICISQYAIVEGYRTGRYRVILEYPNDHDFGFSIDDRLAWRAFLKNDLGLPTHNKEGKPFAYRVYRWGGSPPTYQYFPGKDEEGHPLRLAVYGRLDKMPPKYFKKSND